MGGQRRNHSGGGFGSLLVCFKKIFMNGIIVGDAVKILLDKKFGELSGWYDGIVIRIEPYSEHRCFYWVRLDPDARAVLKISEISVFNPRHIRKVEKGHEV